MIAAFAVWNDRIAPVFDVAGRVSLIEAENGEVLARSIHPLPEDQGFARAEWLTRMGVQYLICGAISRRLQDLIASRGIRVISFVAGDSETILREWLAGRSIQHSFSMPGCRRGRNRRAALPNSEKEEGVMERTRQRTRAGQEGGGQGQGSRRRRERLRERVQAGPGGTCVCPQCGHREPHERGIPCTEVACPSCGQKMVRES